MASQTLTGQNSFRTVVRALGASVVSTALGVARSSHASLRSTIKQGRPFGLHPPHRVAGTDPVVLTQDLDVLGMPLWILRQHLQPRRAEAVPRRDLLRAVVAERVSELLASARKVASWSGCAPYPQPAATSPSTRSGCRMPMCSVAKPPIELPTKNALFAPIASRTTIFDLLPALRSRIDRRLRATTGRNETRGQVPQNVT
ncbi:hypothetical protein [Blastococcus sp. Marseille-P5729]|uniref:hypothetical protein n=1 Tax=Blastococcus sp. Marseille-P5729 TaxID=2086582 RepID=UPI000D0EA59D|nr:hypothetical protein [Blastococcus sp. Marseille-P5729]